MIGQSVELIQDYLQEGLVAILPESWEEGKGGAKVITLRAWHQERRSLPWLLELLARYYRLDLGAVRRHTGRLLRLRHHIPLPLTEKLVLLPVKVRRAAELGEQTSGYVNQIYLEKVEPVEDGLIRCRIICRGGVVVPCLNTEATVRTKLLQGEKALKELLQRQRLTAGPVVPFSGLQDQALRELLPDCDCLLRNMLLLLLEKASRPELEGERRESAATAGARKE